MERENKWYGILCVLAGGSMWGCMGILVRKMNALGFVSMEIAFIRAVIAFIMLFLGILIIKPQILKIKWKDLWCFAGTGIVSFAFFTVCYFKTMTLTSLSIAAVLLYTAPAFVILMSAVLFQEKMTRNKIAALCLAFAGCILVSGVFKEQQNITVAGLMLGLASGIGYALYSIFGRYAADRDYGSVTTTVYTFMFAGAGLLPFVKLKHIGAQAAMIGGKDLLEIVLLIFFVTVAPYICYTKGLQCMENGKASVLASIEPVVATLLGIIIYKEEMTADALLGMLLVLCSIAVLSKKQKGKNVQK